MDIFGEISTYRLWVLCAVQYVKPGEVLFVQELLKSHWRIACSVAVVCDQPRRYFVLQITDRGNPSQKKPGFIVVSLYK